MSKTAIVVGAGHNGLVAAVMLAKRGLKVRVLEDKPVIGGAVRTERPFKKAPGLATSTGAYLLGLMPPEIMAATGVQIPVMRRDPHYFLPTTDTRYLLFGSDTESMKRQFIEFFSEQDWKANVAMNDEIGKIRDDIAKTWMEEPLSIEDTAEKYVRRELRQAFVDLCRKPVGQYIDRFGFKSDLVRAMYAVTDGFSGLYGSWDTPGTGMNFLIHNMCRLPGSDGTWMIVKGGMGTVTRMMADKARELGATIETDRRVESLRIDGGPGGGRVKSVVLANGEELTADVVVCNADPFRMRDLIGRQNLPAEYNARIDGYEKPGSTFKVNMALGGLPKFKCLPEDRGQYGPTIHLLPDEKDVMRHIKEGFAMVQRGELDPFPTIEWYIHTTVDPSLKDDAGNHNSALFVQWVPHTLKGTTWEAEEGKYVKQLLSICDRFAPGTSDLVVDTFPLHPQKIEQHFGIRNGHIHHVDNAFGFADRLPYATPVEGLYSCSAGCHPAGSVIGSAGHNAANRVLKDLKV
ncbi:MAG TPA: NAD(P)/FAD-dependent oxidoreductase [Polyangia bacterium]|nr:NAD(P)/FAD-dependent oxidoreductase [Polyangia bacterium]